MYIHLKNFRCYENKVFEFDDLGLFLISAPSGSGKSTILMAINFALYGSGSKITTYGKKSCSVEFNFDGIKIYRSKCPNSLKVNDIYSDDVGQKIINDKFGNNFSVTGYLSQNGLNSFIVMSPTDKLQFLEEFSFKDCNLSEIKNRCKSLINKRHEEHNKTISQLEITSRILEETKNPEEVVKFPLPIKKSSNLPLIIKNEEIRYKNCETNIKKYNHLLCKLKSELNELKVLNTYIQSKEENIVNIDYEISETINEEINLKSNYIGDDDLDKHKFRLDKLLSLKEVRSLELRVSSDKEKLSKMKEKEIEEIKKEIDEISLVLWNEYKEDECIELINSLKESIKDSRKICFLEKQISNIDEFDEDKANVKLNEEKKLLSDKKDLFNESISIKTVYSCPSCKSELFLENNSLHKHIVSRSIPKDIDISSLKKEIIDIESSIINIEKKISKHNYNKERNKNVYEEINSIKEQYDEDIVESSLIDDLEQIEKYYDEQTMLLKKQKQLTNKLENNIYSTSCKLFEKDINNQENNIIKIKNTFSYDSIEEDDDTYKEEELRGIIILQEKYREKLISINKKKISLEKEKTDQCLQQDLRKKEYLSKYSIIKEEKSIDNEIIIIEDQLKDVENKKNVHDNNLKQIEKYNKYISEKENYDNLKKRVNELQKKEKDDGKKYSAAMQLKENILEAQSISMIAIVESINSHAQIYLEHFFPDHPIIVNLSTFKETKKNNTNKPQINLEIHYKSMECDITNLSGGELSRVILAFTLALGEIFQTPLLLLDESTSSLDQECTSIVFETIKENYRGKLVIVIAHQITEGIFDKVIKQLC